MQLLSLPTTRAALRSLIFASSPPSFSSTPTPNKASGTSPGQRHSFGALAVEIFLEEYKIDGYLNAQCNSKVNSRSTIAVLDIFNGISRTIFIIKVDNSRKFCFD
ncbi:hypothetical protein AAZX31_07G200200 [Glycine max]